MPPLPLIRVAEASPFLHTGIDYMGPVVIQEKQDSVKVYIALFVCLVTRAIHLEIARNLSGEEFLLCLSRFTSRRGCPKIIISDNATNFTFIQPFVGQKVEVLDSKVDLFLNTNNICWRFIPTYSPWHGGAYERLVGLVKRCLRKSIGHSFLDYVQFSTAICRIEDTLNSRPLTYISSTESLTPLTPNHFLRLRTVNALEQIDITRPTQSTSKNLTELWGHTLAIVESFWEVFRNFYLISLREKHASEHKPVKGSVAFIPQHGDVVLIRNPKGPRMDWKVGLVIKMKGHNRSVAEVKVKGKIENHSINHLFPLELPVFFPDRDENPQPTIKRRKTR